MAIGTPPISIHLRIYRSDRESSACPNLNGAKSGNAQSVGHAFTTSSAALPFVRSARTSFVATVEKTPSPAAPPPAEKVAPVAAKPDEGDGKATKGDDPDGLGDIVIDVADDGDDEDDDLIADDVDLGEADDMSDVLDGARDETKTAE